MTKLPFWLLSSYNVAGGRTHPIVARRMDQVMDMWAALMSKPEIASALGIDVDTVRAYVRRARAKGDPRAERTTTKLLQQAKTRRVQIMLLREAGFCNAEIASRLQCHVRLVEMRLKELA